MAHQNARFKSYVRVAHVIVKYPEKLRRTWRDAETNSKHTRIVSIGYS